MTALRLRTDAAKRFKKADYAAAVIWKAMMIAQNRFRKLAASGVPSEVSKGVEFVDGVAVLTGPLP